LNITPTELSKNHASLSYFQIRAALKKLQAKAKKKHEALFMARNSVASDLTSDINSRSSGDEGGKSCCGGDRFSCGVKEVSCGPATKREERYPTDLLWNMPAQDGSRTHMTESVFNGEFGKMGL
jgi:hypothetical protein